jgi:hypothetical protein
METLIERLLLEVLIVAVRAVVARLAAWLGFAGVGHAQALAP